MSTVSQLSPLQQGVEKHHDECVWNTGVGLGAW